jgi:hypothetical protein
MNVHFGRKTLCIPKSRHVSTHSQVWTYLSALDNNLAS